MSQGLISAETAMGIAVAYQEIARGQELLVQLNQDIEAGLEPFPEGSNVEDVFRRSVSGYQLGIPMGSGGARRLITGISPEIARHVIVAHIERQHNEIAELCAKARVELDGG